MTKSEFKYRNLIRLSGLSGLSAVCFDVFIIVFMGFVTPGYEPVRQYISELGSNMNPHANILNIWWSFYSLPMVFFAYGLYSAVKNNRFGWVAPFLIFLDSIGNGVLSGSFSCDVGCHGSGISNTIHLVVSAVGSIAATASPLILYISVRHDSKWRYLSKYLLVIGTLLMATFAVMGYFEFMVISSSRSFGFLGLVQRINTGIYYWFIFVVAKHIILMDSGTGKKVKGKI